MGLRSGQGNVQISMYSLSVGVRSLWEGREATRTATIYLALFFVPSQVCCLDAISFLSSCQPLGKASCYWLFIARLSLHFMVLSPPWPCAGVLRSFLFPNHLVVTVVHFGQQKPSALKQKILDWMAFLSRGVFLSPESRLYLRKKREEDVGQIRHLRR